MVIIDEGAEIYFNSRSKLYRNPLDTPKRSIRKFVIYLSLTATVLTMTTQ